MSMRICSEASIAENPLLAVVQLQGVRFQPVSFSWWPLQCQFRSQKCFNILSTVIPIESLGNCFYFTIIFFKVFFFWRSFILKVIWSKWLLNLTDRMSSCFNKCNGLPIICFSLSTRLFGKYWSLYISGRNWKSFRQFFCVRLFVIKR
jgi:hypothetical protein